MNHIYIPQRLRFQLLAFMVARLVLNTGHRMAYPFLPTFARGVGVDLEVIALALTARSGLGLIGPVFGMLADLRGRRVAMIVSLTLFVGGMMLVTVWPSYPALFAALLLASAAKLIFDPAMQAYIGDRVQYAQRGLAIAITEISWSGAFLLMIPIVGWLIARTDRWDAPFPWLAAFGIVGAAILWRVLPADAPHPGERPALLQGARVVIGHCSALAALAVMLLITLSNEVVNIVFGAWMEDAFELKVAALGAASTVIGLAELGGEGAVAGLADRLGKRRAVSLGIVGNMAACLLLPALGFSIVGALVGLFLFFITFEFALVSALPLMTELVPSARATLMAGNVAAISVGRMVGALIGPPLFDLGLLANGTAGAAFDLLALLVLVLLVRHE